MAISSTQAAPELVAAEVATAQRGRRLPRLSVKIVVGLVLLGIFVLMAIIGPIVAPYDPSAIGTQVLAGPSAAHLLGTTNNGQDVLSELLVGSRATLIVAFVSGALATVLSVMFGVTAGYLAGGARGELLNMLSNIFLVLPVFPLLVVLTAFLPNASAWVVAVVIALIGWAWGARVLRALTLALRNQDFVQAARAVGERTWRIILFEILPNEIAVVAASFLFTVIAAILLYTGLIFLGLGNTNEWSWGLILYWAQNEEALTVGAWWWFIPASLCTALLGTSVGLIGFGIDEFINPRLRAAGLSRKELRSMSMNQGLTPVYRNAQDVATGSLGQGITR
jgi:peptide/nickel transport system permease protein